MPALRGQRPLNVALLGNPNTGKSTLFSALVGVHQRVGNYPGVTVEKKTGHFEHQGQKFTVIDLPGLYSLSPNSRDESVVIEVLSGREAGVEPIDAVLCIVDASNLERNLYLTSQALDLGLPLVLALNMLDVADQHGVRVNATRLAEQLGCPVVPIQANRGLGLDELKQAMTRIAESSPPTVASPLPETFRGEVDRLQASHAGDGASTEANLPRWLVERLLLDVSGRLQRTVLSQSNGRLGERLQEARDRLAAGGVRVPGVETASRYDWVHRVVAASVTQPKRFKTTISDRVDHVLTHRFWGSLLFLFVMVAMFQAVFVWAEPLMEGIDAGIKFAQDLVSSRMAEGALSSLLVDGVLGGVGSVLTFLPQIVILFLFLAVLEDCGYMARAAYLMDGLMVRVGLSGKSFIPLLSSFACAVPGIMATRVIENERDRLTTILVAPLMTCSARLPIYTLLIAAFIPREAYLGGLLRLQGLTMVGLYLLGIVAAVTAAKVFKKTILRGGSPPFLMELPSYKWPSLRTVALRVAERAYLFTRFAGTMIMAVSILVWAALYYPHDPQVAAPLLPEQQRLEAELESLAEDDPAYQATAGALADVEREIAGAYQRQSYLGRFGRAIEPVFRPLGWDWRIGSSVIASLPAREIVVATLGVIFNLGSEEEMQSEEGAIHLKAKLQAATWDGTHRPLFTVPVALSIMVFYALCAQCAATLAVIRRETNTWRWPAFTFVYMTVLAYVAALVTYQAGTWLLG